jgi:hypothetical protein
MKKDISKTKSKEKIKIAKTSKKKSKEKEEKKFEEEKQEEQEKKHNFTPEIEEAEEEKQFIKESKRDFIPEGLDNDFQETLPSISGKSKVSLDKINSKSKSAFNLENFLEDSPLNQQKSILEEEFDPFNYTSTKKKNEQEYHVMSQDYSSIQKEVLKYNPQIIVKSQSLIDLNKKNIVEKFPEQKMNPFVEESLRNTNKDDKNYVFNASFKDPKKKSSSPFEKKENNYEPLS